MKGKADGVYNINSAILKNIVDFIEKPVFHLLINAST